MDTYKHSVALDADKCRGCTTCLKHCPTEAIRIVDGHAKINTGRCIDCGICIKICQNKAKKATYSRLDKVLKTNKYKIALPAPTLYGQFEDLEDVDYVLQGLKDIGFDDVFEVSKAAELVSAYTRTYLKTVGIPKPVINSACPVVLRLISLRYPTLKEHIMQILPPMEIAAKLALERAMKEHPELTREDICVCFISPCPGKVSYVRNGFGDYQSEVDEVLSISDVYFSLINVMRRGKEPENLSESGMIGISWATTGGEASALFNDKYLAADGIENVIRVLEEIENNKLQDPFFQQVFKPLVAKVRRERNISLYIRGDEEKKTEKATRIEANLEPMNRDGNLILNEAEKDNPHMKELEDQFKLFTLTLKYPADGPDAVEGGNRIIDKTLRNSEPATTQSRRSQRSKNKHRL